MHTRISEWSWRSLPAVREADADTLVIADGFSCREQITQGTGRTPRHLAEVLRTALAHPPPPPRGCGRP